MASQGDARAVRDVTFDVMRERGLTTIFANPGSTEVSFLGALPDDIRFVLALHEGSVVGIASGYAIGRGEPACVLVHTTAGLGNSVAALATARVNRAPLVVLVGQQDRRHLAYEPFLTGRLAGLAGDYPVSVEQPARAQDVPAAIARAWHEARLGRGPALVIVPMDDWLAPAESDREPATAGRVLGGRAADPPAVAELSGMVDGARSPALVVGAGADSVETWAALMDLAEKLGCPVWQESFGARAGFPQDHPLFAGHLPSGRARLREVLGGHDLVLVVGAGVFRQYPFEPGPFVEEGTRVALVTDDPAEAHRSPAELVLLAEPAAVCAELAGSVSSRSGAAPVAFARPEPPAAPGPGESLRAGHVLAALGGAAARGGRARGGVAVEPPGAARAHPRPPAARVPQCRDGRARVRAVGADRPAHGLAERPVVAVVGDGSSLYSIQALWSAARYEVGVLFVILNNGGYRVMDRLAEMQGESAPWPGFGTIDVSGMARALGCDARRVDEHGELLAALDEVLPGLAGRTTPLLLEVIVEPDPDFDP